MVQLTILAGPDADLTYELGEGTYSLGRSPDNSVIIQDPCVSRCHALVICRKGGCRVEDLGSTNGTFHNEFRVTECPLNDGDRLAIGETELRFVRAAPKSVRSLFGSRLRDRFAIRAEVRRPVPLPREMLHAISVETGLLVAAHGGAMCDPGRMHRPSRWRKE